MIEPGTVTVGKPQGLVILGRQGIPDDLFLECIENKSSKTGKGVGL